MEGIIAIIMVFGIPLSVIFSITYLKAKKLQLIKAGGGGVESSIIQSLRAENANLRNRVENLEMIMSDSDLLKLKEYIEEERLQEKAKEFKDNY